MGQQNHALDEGLEFFKVLFETFSQAKTSRTDVTQRDRPILRVVYDFVDIPSNQFNVRENANLLKDLELDLEIDLDLDEKGRPNPNLED